MHLPALENQLRLIETIILDIDGVMTDGRLYYGADGILKAFDVQDGHAIKLAQRAGLRCGVYSGRDDEVNRRRAADLKLDFAHYGELDKGKAFPGFCQKFQIDPDRALFIGDDIVDIPVMRQVRIGVAVANATDDVKSSADWVTQAEGGRGAIREVIYTILQTKGLLSQITERYFL